MTASTLPARTGRPGTGTPGSWAMAVRAFRCWLVNYRRTWRGSIYSSVLGPVLYLGAMGFALGKLVDQHGTASLGGVSYLTFLAPGLMAASAMQTAVGESLYPVYVSVKWQQTYQAAAATPLRPGDIYRGHVLFTAMRLVMNMTIFLGVMAAFGAIRSPWAVALPAGRRADGTGVRHAPRRVRGDPVEDRPGLQHDLQVRHDPAVPVQRDVLPDHPAAGLDPAGGLRHPAMARGGALPRTEPRHRGPSRRPRPRRVPGRCSTVLGLWAGHHTYRRRLHV